MDTIFTPSQSWWQLVTSIDTPTVCNAIEVAQGKRGFDNFTRQTVLSAHPTQASICGYALTARIKASEPPLDDATVIKQRRMDYYRYMSEISGPCVTVIEDTDWPLCVGAFWGEINTTIHHGFGISGVVTNGVMRDLGDLQDDFQVIAGSVGPSHAFVHVLDFNQPVEVFGMRVKPGDIVHADRHGALVIPQQVLPYLEQSIHTLLESERLILEPARQKGFDFDAFEKAWQAFEKART